jgi:hypothetical protein
MRRNAFIALVVASITFAGGPLVTAAIAQSAGPPAASPGDRLGPPPGPGGPGGQFGRGGPDATMSPGAPDARRQARREQIRATRAACREEAIAQGLTGPDRRQHVKSCFAAKMPRVAKRMECRREGMAKGMVQPELRDFVRQCLASRG